MKSCDGFISYAAAQYQEWVPSLSAGKMYYQAVCHTGRFLRCQGSLLSKRDLILLKDLSLRLQVRWPITFLKAPYCTAVPPYVEPRKHNSEG